jgi:hypothetical protein
MSNTRENQMTQGIHRLIDDKFGVDDPDLPKIQETDVFLDANEEIGEGDNIVTYSRVSHETQKANLVHQKKIKVEFVRSRKAIIKKQITYTGPGTDLSKFMKAVRYAKRFNAKLLVVSPLRVMRPAMYYFTRDQKTIYSQSDLHKISKALDGVKLVVIVSPEMDPSEIRSEEIKRGQKATGNIGGITRKMSRKDRRGICMSVAIEKRNEGLSCREIAKYLKRTYRIKITHVMVFRWVQSSTNE